MCVYLYWGISSVMHSCSAYNGCNGLCNVCQRGINAVCHLRGGSGVVHVDVTISTLLVTTPSKSRMTTWSTLSPLTHTRTQTPNCTHPYTYLSQFHNVRICLAQLLQVGCMKTRLCKRIRSILAERSGGRVSRVRAYLSLGNTQRPCAVCKTLLLPCEGGPSLSALGTW